MANKGLSEKEASELRKKCGENLLPLKEDVSWLSILLSQLKSPLIYILMVAIIIYIIKPVHWILALSVAVLSTLVIEAVKVISNRKKSYANL